MERTIPLLEAQDVAFSYQDSLLLQPVSLHVYPGDYILLTGPSGSGKSTLLKILASLLTPTAGQIRFENRDINTLKPEDYRRQVSYCFQTPQLFGDTVYDNLALPWQLRQQKPPRDKLAADLTSVNLTPDMLDKSIEQLSGGEKQRIGLLRNLQFVPKVLLLDEVTSALDKENKLAVLSLINRFVAQEKVAVVSVSHDVNDIQQAANVLCLEAPKKRKGSESA
ncbi:iron ABC transporter ATP-binding protein FetA [Candidatus Pantoea deserta]|uniref:Iron ABC transporter ATP-binding protein FetA n=1 Tax=Candidatus Pantoea deserta TaxID=1869313 RepID=A0A3N4P980_9GAMM|nr:iron ABC transporter ATP-binding protein FetA [Pantoea deserta]RPE01317.1 iron ABC transporter ATP-binding protein FetA [Pantoea deserta]